MRRTFVTALLGEDLDPNSVRRLAGHSDSHSAVASAMLRKLDVDVLSSVNDAGAIEVPAHDAAIDQAIRRWVGP